MEIKTQLNSNVIISIFLSYFEVACGRIIYFMLHRGWKITEIYVINTQILGIKVFIFIRTKNFCVLQFHYSYMKKQKPIPYTEYIIFLSLNICYFPWNQNFE